MNRNKMARELRRIAELLLALEFPTEDSLEKYLKEHPEADRSLHKVVEEKKAPPKPEAEPPKEKAPKSEAEAPKEPKKPEEAAPPKLKKLMEEPPEKLTPEQHELYKEKISQYKVEIVGDNDESAKQVAAALAKGIKDTADVCQVNPPICSGNLGITRDNMPQLHDKSLKDMKADAAKDETESKGLAKKAEAATDAVDKADLTKKAKKKAADAEDTRKKVQAAIDAGADPNDDKSTTDKLLDQLEESGVKIQGRKGDTVKIPVGQLRATQREIQAKKTVSMADAYLSGKFRPNKNPIIVSTEEDGSHCILDGHHRWSSALMADNDMEMNCVVVGKPIRDMLKTAMSMAGVYRADLKGNIVPKDKPLDLSGWKEGEERKVTEARSALAQLVEFERCLGL